jgi:hypothetical protein
MRVPVLMVLGRLGQSNVGPGVTHLHDGGVANWKNL